MQPLWKTIGRVLRKLKVELLCYPVIPLLAIYPNKMKALIQKAPCTPMSIAALFIIAKKEGKKRDNPNVHWLING